MRFPARRSMLAAAAGALALSLVVASPAAAAVNDPAVVPDSPQGYGLVADEQGGFYFTVDSAEARLGHYDGAAFTVWDGPTAPHQVNVLGLLGDLVLLSALGAGETGNSYLWSFDPASGEFTAQGALDGDASSPSQLVVIGDVAYFAAENVLGEDKLWSFDGSVLGEFAWQNVIDVGAFDGMVFFSAFDTPGVNLLNVYDPVTTSHAEVPGMEFPEIFTTAGDNLFFVAYNGGQHLVSYDSSTDNFTEYTGAGAPEQPWNLAEVDGTLYFHALVDGAYRMQFFDGTDFQVIDGPGAPDFPFYFEGFDGRIFYGHQDGIGAWDPATGAFQSWAGSPSGNGFVVIGDRLFFSNDTDGRIWFFGPAALAATGSEAALPLGALAVTLLALGAIGVGVTQRRRVAV